MPTFTRRFPTVLVQGGLFCALLVGVVSAGDRPLSAVERIQDAHARGEIDAEAATLLSVRAVTRPDLLPEAYRSPEAKAERCGTLILREALAMAQRLSPGGRAQLAADLNRPSTSSYYDSPDLYFRIHYNTGGGHAVPADDADLNLVPDYVERIAAYADSSWKVQVGQYGYLAPPSDDTAGGSSAYDIYCQSIGAYGYASPELAGPAPWNDYSSYVVVHNTFDGFPPNSDPDGDQAGAAKATVAHEFQHACQFAYDEGENGSWMEMTATWMEDEVFDPVNDNYNYLNSFFSSPDVPLFSTSPYGAFVWPRYIAEVFGAATLETIWDGCISGPALTVIDQVLTAQGRSRALAFADFTAWNWITNIRDDGAHYEEAAAYPLVSVMRSHATYPVSAQTSAEPPGGLGSNYIQLNTAVLPAGRSLALSFDGDDGWMWAATLVAENPGGAFEIIPFTLDAGGAGDVSLHNASVYSNVALIPALLNVSGGAGFSYSACAGPDAPPAISPLPGDSAALPLTLGWEAVAGAISYHVQVDLDSLFGSPEVDSVTTQPTAVLEGLIQDTAYYWRVAVTNACGESDFGPKQSFLAVCGILLTGDADASGSITAADVIVMVNHIFKSGAPPLPQWQAGDVDCSGALTSADIVKLVNYTFKSGTPPCDACSTL